MRPNILSRNPEQCISQSSHVEHWKRRQNSGDDIPISWGSPYFQPLSGQFVLYYKPNVSQIGATVLRDHICRSNISAIAWCRCWRSNCGKIVALSWLSSQAPCWIFPLQLTSSNIFFIFSLFLLVHVVSSFLWFQSVFTCFSSVLHAWFKGNVLTVKFLKCQIRVFFFVQIFQTVKDFFLFEPPANIKLLHKIPYDILSAF